MVGNSVTRTVLITGAAGSLGAALSRECASMGFNTVMLDKNGKGLDSVWDSIVGAGFQEPFLHPLDLASAGPEQFDLIANSIESEFGGLDGVIHCAASFNGLRPLDQIAPMDWLEQIQVNLNAPWLLSVACLPLLRRSENSFLYFILEDLEKMKSGYWGAYGASKHALSVLMHQLSVETSPTSLHVLGINPGPMASPLRAEAFHAEDPGTLPDPLIAAQKICHLFSDRSEESGSFVNLENQKDL